MFTDAPIDSPDQDRLDRSDFAHLVARRIMSASGDDSVVFALTGEWGGGKTSLLRMIQRELVDGGWTVERFTPWATSDPGTLVAEFYSTISASLPPKLRKKVRGHLAKLISVGSAAASIIPYAGGAASAALSELQKYISSPQPYDAQFRALSDELEDAGVRIVVVVDDLDRLHGDELVAVLKTVRLLGNFPGIHYLLSYDLQTVQAVLASTSVGNNDTARALSYMEKIVQYPFAVPPMQPVHRDREFVDGLIDLAQRAQLIPNVLNESDVRGLSATVLDLIPVNDLQTLRSIHRLIAQVDVVLASIGPAEVNLHDLVLVTYIRLFYPSLHESIYARRNDFLGLGFGDFFGDSRPSESEWKSWIQTETGSLSIVNRAAIQNVLHFLFENIPSSGRLLGVSRATSFDTMRISNRDYFDRYFLRTVPRTDISDGDVVLALEALARGSSLPPDDAFIVALEDDRVRLACNKAASVIERHGEIFSSETARRAAFDLATRLLPDLNVQSPHPSVERLVGALIVRSIGAAEDMESAKRLIHDFELHVGLQMATLIFQAGGAYEADGVLAAKIDAFQEHRDRQISDCVSDMASSSEEARPSVLFYWDHLDRPSKDTLADWASRQLEEGVGVDEIAAHFVTISRFSTGEHVNHVYSREFSELIPSEKWSFPAGSGNSLELTSADSLFERRRKIAVYNLSRS